MNTVKIGGVPEHFNLPWHLAIENSKFKALNIDLKWKDIHGGTGEMIEDLKSKSLDIAILLTEGITKGILQGLNAKIIQVYVKTPLIWGIYVPYDSEIQTINDLKHKNFAISRYGSGSHLMTFVKANAENWDIKKLNFIEVKNLEGGLNSLENNICQGFLWEKFTTYPYTKNKRCRMIDQVITPWPCFSIAVTNHFYETKKNYIDFMLKTINQSAYELKQNKNSIELISNRYDIPKDKVKIWLNNTDWNYDGNFNIRDFEKTVNHLLNLNLVNKNESLNWEKKLFP